MSDFFLRMNLEPFFASPPKNEEELFSGLARFIARKLDRIVDTLEERGLVFEMGTAGEMSRALVDFADGDGSCYGFSKHWDDLVDWGERPVTIGRRDKSLCSIPNLPNDFTC